MTMTMTMTLIMKTQPKIIILGDYKVVRINDGVGVCCLYHLDKYIGMCNIVDGILHWVDNVDQELITMLLLKYPTIKGFRLYD